MKNFPTLLIPVALLVLAAVSPVPAQAPAWWANHAVLNTNPPSDFARVNQGQVKWLATQAAAEFARTSTNWPALPGASNIMAMAASFAPSNNFRAVNLGQLKQVAAPFYSFINQCGLTNAYPPGASGPYPWSGSAPGQDDFALANIGQAKYLFSFASPKSLDTDQDGLLDIDELHWVDGTIQNPDVPAWYQLTVTSNQWVTVIPATVLGDWQEKREYHGLTIDGYVPVDLPWPVSFYASVYTTAYVSLHGLARFNAGNDHRNQSLPTYCPACPFVAPFWDDLALTAGSTVTKAMDGIRGHRRYVLSWLNVARYDDPSASLNFQVVFVESNATILLNYGGLTGSMADGGSATIGMQSPPYATAYAVDSPALKANLSLVFTPLYRTDPASRDSDNDGMPDGWEIAHGMNPLDPSDAGQDPDGDGLLNLLEFRVGTAPRVSNTGLDSDHDGMPDVWEVLHDLKPFDPSDAGLDPDRDGLANLQEYQHGVNPHNPDTDGDGLSDAEEGALGTSPLAPDTDGDGIPDLLETQLFVITWNTPATYTVLTNLTGQGTCFDRALLDGKQIAADCWNNNIALLRNNGHIIVWGDNSCGQTNVPPCVTSAVAVAVSGDQIQALLADGHVVAWGDGPAVPGGMTNITAIAASFWNNLALRADGTVVEWGWSGAGMQGGLSNVAAIAASEYGNIALCSNGTVVAWTDDGTLIPPPEGLSNVVAVAAGGYAQFMALRRDGTTVAWCWEAGLQWLWDQGREGIQVPTTLSNVVAISGCNYSGFQYVTADNRLHGVGPVSDCPIAARFVSASALGGVGYAIVNLGTSATRADSDGDGIADSLELAMGTDPADAHSWLPAVIRTQPSSQTNRLGQPLSFSVEAIGPEPLAFQWLRNGVPLPGETNSNLVFTPVLADHDAGYRVVVAGALGMATSAVAGINLYCAITASASPGCSITPAGTNWVPYGSSLAFTNTPDPHWWLAGTIVDGLTNPAVPPAVMTLSNIVASHSVRLVADSTLSVSSVLTNSYTGLGDPDGDRFPSLHEAVRGADPLSRLSVPSGITTRVYFPIQAARTNLDLNAAVNLAVERAVALGNVTSAVVQLQSDKVYALRNTATLTQSVDVLVICTNGQATLDLCGTNRIDAGGCRSLSLSGLTIVNAAVWKTFDNTWATEGGIQGTLSMRDCIVSNCLVTGINGWWFWGWTHRSLLVGSGILVNCVVVSNRVDPTISFCCLLMEGSFSAVNCTFAGNRVAGGQLCSPGSTLLNSIVWGNSGVVAPSGQAAASCIEGGSLANGCITGNPCFTPGGWSLQANSPCISRGMTDGAPAWDMMGTPRGLAVDMGAYECVEADADNDQLPDVWEDSTGLSADPRHGLADSDGDGLLNIQEWQQGTHPLVPDTDDDGLSDRIEVDLGLNPLKSNYRHLVLELGEAFSLDVGAGDKPLTCQWLKNGLPIPAATNLTYEKSGAQLSDHGALYQAVLSSVLRCATCAVAMVQVKCRLVASAELGGAITPSGESVLEIGASQSYLITTNDGFGVVDVVIDGMSVGPKTGYTFTGINGNHTIHTRFGQAPAITNWSGSLYLRPGSAASFSVGASGYPLSYFWFRNGQLIPGATNNVFSLPVVDSGDHGSSFAVVVSNVLGSVTSSVAVLTVVAQDADCDGDGLPDWWEYLQGLNPLDPEDAEQDADADELSNLDEYQQGTSLRNADTDGDGVMDGIEGGALLAKWSSPAGMTVVSGIRPVAVEAGNEYYAALTRNGVVLMDGAASNSWSEALPEPLVSLLLNESTGYTNYDAMGTANFVIPAGMEAHSTCGLHNGGILSDAQSDSYSGSTCTWSTSPVFRRERNFSVFGWFCLSEGNGHQPFLMINRESDSNPAGYELVYLQDGRLSLGVCNNHEQWEGVSFPFDSLGQWTHVGIAVDASNVFRVYTNGVVAGVVTQDLAGVFTERNTVMAFGGTPEGVTLRCLNGKYDDCTYFDTCLSPQQVQTLYKQQLNNETVFGTICVAEAGPTNTLAGLRAYHYGSSDIVESPASLFRTDCHGTIFLRDEYWTWFETNSLDGRLVIPWAIGNETIRAIGDGFWDSSVAAPTNLYLPKTVTTIGQGAFWGASFSSVYLPGVVSIGDYAFNTCGAQEFYMPLLESVGMMAFYSAGIRRLNAPLLSSFGSAAFGDCRQLVDIYIPKGQSIGEGAFASCRALASISLPGAISIGSDAFWDCPALRDVYLPSAATIGDWAFWDCTNLVSTTLPNVKSLGTAAFEGCAKLLNVSLPSLVSVSPNAFYEMPELKTLTLSSMVNVPDYMVGECPNLTSVYLSAVRTLALEAFWNCNSLTAVFYSVDAPTVAEGEFSVTFTNYVLNPVAVGWGDTLGGRPVVRLQGLADNGNVPSVVGNGGIRVAINASAIAAGSYHLLTLLSNGTVNVRFDARFDAAQAVVPRSVSNVVAIAAGNVHSLALLSNGTVKAWGGNALGQAAVPLSVSNVVAIAAGRNHSLVLLSDGTVKAWGDNTAGQTNVPTGLCGVKAIAAGSAHSMALLSNGTVVAWGSNRQGQTNVPAAVAHAVAIEASSEYGIAMLSNGNAVVWGGGGTVQMITNATGLGSVGGGLSGALVCAGTNAVQTWGMVPACGGRSRFGTATGRQACSAYVSGPDVCGVAVIQGGVGTSSTRADTDGDGMPDGWEVHNGLNPHDSSDAAVDLDGDGLSNLEECQQGTDPRNPDTDGGGIPDGWEVTHGLNPLQAGDDVALGADERTNLQVYQNDDPSLDPAHPAPGTYNITIQMGESPLMSAWSRTVLTVGMHEFRLHDAGSMARTFSVTAGQRLPVRLVDTRPMDGTATRVTCRVWVNGQPVPAWMLDDSAGILSGGEILLPLPPGLNASAKSGPAALKSLSLAAGPSSSSGGSAAGLDATLTLSAVKICYAGTTDEILESVCLHDGGVPVDAVTFPPGTACELSWTNKVLEPEDWDWWWGEHYDYVEILVGGLSSGVSDTVDLHRATSDERIWELPAGTNNHVMAHGSESWTGVIPFNNDHDNGSDLEDLGKTPVVGENDLDSTSFLSFCNCSHGSVATGVVTVTSGLKLWNDDRKAEAGKPEIIGAGTRYIEGTELSSALGDGVVTERIADGSAGATTNRFTVMRLEVLADINHDDRVDAVDLAAAKAQEASSGLRGLLMGSGINNLVRVDLRTYCKLTTGDLTLHTPAGVRLRNLDGSIFLEAGGTKVWHGPEIAALPETRPLYAEGLLPGEHFVTYSYAGINAAGDWTTYSATLPVTVLKVDIAMDGNRDGDIDFNGTNDNHCLFWVNDDCDTLWYNTADGNSLIPGSGQWEEDDLQVGEQGRTAVDFLDNVINCKRDLEDFTRLQIKVDANIVNMSGITYSLKLENDVPDSGQAVVSVNVFKALDETTHYLTVSGIADQQVQEPKILTVTCLGDELPSQYIRGNNQISPFIVEGGIPGRGDLVFIVKKNGVEICRKTLSLEMHKINWFYDIYRTTVVSGTESPRWDSRVRSTSVQEQQSQYRPEHADESLLYVHGWNMSDEWEKRRWIETVFKRMWWQGYKGNVGLFSWPTLWGFDGSFRQILTDAPHFDNSEFRAWQSADSLANLFSTLNAGGTLRVIAHSMGNIVVGEALRKYSGSQPIHTYIATQAAMSSHYYDGNVSAPVPQYFFLVDPISSLPITTPNIYGHFPTGNSGSSPYFNGNHVKVQNGHMFNYFNSLDYALNGYRWELNNVLKPDDVTPYFFYYTGSATSYSEVGASPDRFSKGIIGDPNLEILSVGNDLQRYKIFSYCAESRVKALGTQNNVTGGFDGHCFDLQSLPTPFTDEHYSHSRQFRSNVVVEDPYWAKVFEHCGFVRD